MILAVPKGERRNDGSIAGRILGYYQVESMPNHGKIQSGNTEYQHYVRIKNLLIKFSEKARRKDLINLDDIKKMLSVKINTGTWRSGYSILEKNDAEKIIKNIQRRADGKPIEQ